MFRNPRETSGADIGRPPTPPHLIATPRAVPSPIMQPSMAANPPRIPKASQKATTRNTAAAKTSPARGKASGNGNASILTFFKKAEPQKEREQENASLFLTDEEEETDTRLSFPPGAERTLSVRAGQDRYNESGAASKRRKMEIHEEESGSELKIEDVNKSATPILQEIDISNSQEVRSDPARRQSSRVEEAGFDAEPKTLDAIVANISRGTPAAPPVLQKENTSVFDDTFEGIEDFENDEFPEEGEENIERRWMEEQRFLELDFENDDDGPEERESKPMIDEQAPQHPTAACPICGKSLEGMDTPNASVHVNDCLDGNNPAPPSPLVEEDATKGSDGIKSAVNPPYKRFQRAAIARPGQESPFTLDNAVTGGSAFSKLMASHAEDTAWAAAAANEMAARGKPAYKRTCPFYKILPGFSICVDAFRYGAVEGCNAYFLSHFHSDHYIGLTSSWCHGPIYCSRVTANLVRQQLRVDPKWVVDLEWDSKIEVPRTQGVQVTMIPANHCPGSSLYLFEKAVGRGPKPKLQRVLHCGDFRACPAHVQHPLLRPELIDLATGRKRAQKLDVCYLDTTYLTPKYAFPQQEEVIKACADMCVSLSKDRVDEGDGWEQMKKQRAGSGMTRFVQKEVSTESKDTKDSTAAMPEKNRGRLLVIVGTYSIGKERICLGIARALNSKIFAAPGKQRICAALEDPELSALLTDDPLEAQVHMQMLMEIRAETLADYLTGYKPHFSRIVGFRPSGWNYRPPSSRFTESPLIQTVLHSDNWKPSYSMAELVPQRGSTRESSCFGVPYSEHSSFRELTMFCCALHIDKIIPTVNVGSAKSREKMKGWIDKWAMDKKKSGLFKVADDAVAW